MLVYSKDNKQVLTFGLTAKEFRCRCGYPECSNIIVHPRLLLAFRKFRFLVDTPLEITSGHRCHRHNHDVGGVDISRHTSGEAIDISSDSLLKKFYSEDIMKFAKEAGFTFIKEYETLDFYHFDIRAF